MLGGPIATLMLPPVFPASHFDTESQLKRGAGDGESYLGVRPVGRQSELVRPKVRQTACVRLRGNLSGTVVCGGQVGNGAREAGRPILDPQC